MPAITAASTQPALRPVLIQSPVRNRLLKPDWSVASRYCVLFTTDIT